MPSLGRSLFTAPGPCQAGWTTAPLADYADVVGGGTPKTDEPSFWDGHIPWATPTELTAVDGGRLTATNRSITAAGLKGCNAVLLPEGTLLMTSRATIGATAIADTAIATNQGFQSLVPKANCDVNFLQAQIQLAKARLTRLAQGSTFLEISPSTLRKVEFHWPPLDEQRRIAALLNGIDSAAGAGASAMSGQKQILWGLLDQQFGASASHPHATIGHHFDLQLGKMLNKAAREGPNQMPYLANQHVQWFQPRLHNLPTMSFDEDQPDKFSIQDGDLLMCEGGEIGRCFIWAQGQTDIKFQKAIHRLRAKSGDFLPEYLLWYMFHATRHGTLSASSGKTSIAHLTRDTLSKMKVPLPPVPEQRGVVRVLSAIQAAIHAGEAVASSQMDAKQGLLSRLLENTAPVEVVA